MSSLPGLIFLQEATSLPVVADGTEVTAWAELTGKADTTAPGASGTRPTYLNNAFGALPGLRFNGSNQYMRTASFAQAQPFTVVFAARSRVTLPGAGRYIDGNTVNQLVLNAQADVYAGSAFVARNLQTRMMAPNVFTIAVNGASTVLYINGIAQAAAATPGANAITDGLTYGAAGNLAGGFFAAMDMYGIAVYSGILSAANRAIAEAYFAAKIGANLDAPAPAKRIIFDGDSLTVGFGNTGGGSYPVQLLTALGFSGYSPRNFGVSGQTLAQMETGAVAEVDSQYDPSRGINVLVVWGGTNDIILGADAATVQSRLVTYCNNRRAAGWYVIVCDIIARGNFSAPQNAIKDAVNAYIAANYSAFANAYVPLSARAELSNPLNTSYYSADTIHLIDNGYGVVAATILPFVQAVIPNAVALSPLAINVLISAFENQIAPSAGENQIIIS